MTAGTKGRVPGPEHNTVSLWLEFFFLFFLLQKPIERCPVIVLSLLSITSECETVIKKYEASPVHSRLEKGLHFLCPTSPVKLTLP